MGTRCRPKLQEEQVLLFWLVFHQTSFLTKLITKSGYPAWLSLKNALDTPHIKDLMEVDSIQQEAFRNRFIKEGYQYSFNLLLCVKNCVLDGTRGTVKIEGNLKETQENKV